MGKLLVTHVDMSLVQRCRSLLSKMFNLAEKWGLIPQNSSPVKFTSKYIESSKERYVSEAKIDLLSKQLTLEELERPYHIAAQSCHAARRRFVIKPIRGQAYAEWLHSLPGRRCLHRREGRILGEICGGGFNQSAQRDLLHEASAGSQRQVGQVYRCSRKGNFGNAGRTGNRRARKAMG